MPLKVQNNTYQKNQNNPQKIELSNAVTKFSRLDYTSYTIPIINSIQNITSFQNMVIETDDVREAAYLITYYPNNNYQKVKNAKIFMKTKPFIISQIQKLNACIINEK